MSSDITVRVDEGVVNLRVGAVILKDNEVYEELGVELSIDRLGFVSENYFYGDTGDNTGREIYEICFYYYMKTPADYEPRVSSVTNSGITETFEWIPFDTDKTIYPVFFKTELYEPCDTVKHIIADERIKKKNNEQ